MSSSAKRILQKTPRFTRDLKKLSKPIQEEAFGVAQMLTENLFHPTLNVRHLTGFKGLYRVVVMKDYRLIFSCDADTLCLLRIAHRKDIYRTFEL